MTNFFASLADSFDRNSKLRGVSLPPPGSVAPKPVLSSSRSIAEEVVKRDGFRAFISEGKPYSLVRMNNGWRLEIYDNNDAAPDTQSKTS